jgi:carbonic anhydrase
MKFSNKLILGYSAAMIIGPVIKKYLNLNDDNVKTSSGSALNLNKAMPNIGTSVCIDEKALVIGDVKIGNEVLIAPFASIRGDEGQKIYIGNQCNLQDGSIIHGLRNFNYGHNIIESSILDNNRPYSIYIGDRVTMSQQSQINGPCRVGNDVFIGMQCLISKSIVGDTCVIEPGAKVIDVSIPNNRYVPAGQVISDQNTADNLPMITPGYKYYNFNQKIINANIELARGETSSIIH